MIIILLGAPGAGKGTQAAEIIKDFDIVPISTGDLLREEVKKGSDLGINAKTYMDKGELVPDEVILAMLEKRVKAPDCANGFILDGFPRNTAQADMLKELFSNNGMKLDCVVNIAVDKESIVKRLSNRLTCSKCKEGYNRVSKPPKEDGVCDKCGGSLFQRDDDKEATIRNRLNVYDNKTAPLIDYYKKEKLIIDIDGSKGVLDIYSDIKDKLSAFVK